MNQKLYGTTLFLGLKELNMIFGKFYSLVYLDVITQRYIIALIDENTYLNLGKLDQILYTRIHSSCITSEMFESQDCDCVEQLYGAIELISKNGGILFYLIQEGRGCGYIGKARGCQIVQYDEYNNGEMTTFDAYKKLGMKKDYRSYHNIKEILIMLNIYDHKFYLLTNNPDKINGLKELNINIIDIKSIEFKPNIFNRSYLISKQNSGHLFKNITQNINFFGLDPNNKKINLPNYLPFKPIEEFKPYHLKDFKRFILCAKYYIPIKPINNRFVLNEKQINYLTTSLPLENNLKKKTFETFDNFVYLDDDIVTEYYIKNPYWFKVNLYYDITTNLEYVLLEYTNPFKDCTNIKPIIRVHSESIFDRFPLIEKIYKNRYRFSIQKIIENGKGFLLLFYRDGRGSGLGYYLIDHYTSGVKNDMRDYHAACQILKNHIGDIDFDILYTNFSKFNLKFTAKQYNLNIINWIPINDTNQLQITQRIFDLDTEYNKYINNFNSILKLDSNYKYIVTGIGSSAYHAKFIYNLLNNDGINIIFINFMKSIQYKYDDEIVIVVTQGLSSNSKILLNKLDKKNIILFSSKNIPGINQNIDLFTEKNDNTLVRISGPIINYAIIYKTIYNKKICIDFSRLYDKAKKHKLSYVKYEQFRNSQIIWIIDGNIDEYIGEINNKFMEIFYCYSGKIVSYLEFVHGVFQSSLYHDNIIYILMPSDYQNLVNKMLKEELVKQVYDIPYLGNNHSDIIKYEIFFTYIIDRILNNSDIEDKFVVWKGIKTQKMIYDIELNNMSYKFPKV